MDDIPEKIDNILNEIPYMILGVQGKNIDHNDGFALCGRLRFAIFNEIEKLNKENNEIIANLVREREELKNQIDKLKRIQRVRNSLD